MGAHHGILIVVEDDDDLRSWMEQLLQDEGYLVLPAREGAEALERMRGVARGYARRVAAIVDLDMPGVNGWELIARMRGDLELREIPVLVVSGHDARPPQGQVVRVLQKPCRRPELLAAVACLIPPGS